MKRGDIHDQFARTAVNRSELEDLDEVSFCVLLILNFKEKLSLFEE